MKIPKELVCDIAPGCHLKAGFVIYPSIKLLRIAFGSKIIDGDVEAFCACKGGGKNEKIITLHFYRRKMSHDIIAHEVFHAVAELIRVLHLNLEDQYAQELCAHAVSHLMKKAALAKKLIKK
jgi:hypothetical protein